jgi:pyridoxal phosphate enzyme (YggS family)
MAADAAPVAENVLRIRERITIAGGTRVTLVAVTKTHPFASMRAAIDAGCDAVGENYVQEILEKLDGRLSPGPLHMIGSIQSNKVRRIDRLVSLWGAVDRVSVIDEIGRRAESGGCRQILLQVNTTGETSKSGCLPGEIDALRARADAAGLSVEGLMTIGPTEGSLSSRQQAFALLRRLCDTGALGVCSMGMSDDFEVAVGCGSTMVRIGSAIFGPRR